VREIRRVRKIREWGVRGESLLVSVDLLVPYLPHLLIFLTFPASSI
jgi:hypothetical protein